MYPANGTQVAKTVAEQSDDIKYAGQNMAEKADDNRDEKAGYYSSGINDEAASQNFLKKHVILIVTRNGHLTESVMAYGLNVAERLNLRLLVAYVNTMPLLWDGGVRNNRFAEAVQESIADLKARAHARGVLVDYVKEAGRVAKVVSRLCRTLKCIEFIIVDKDIKIEEVIIKASVPVFNVFSNEIRRQGLKPGHSPVSLYDKTSRENDTDSH